MESDANLILTAENLRLDTDLVRGQKVKGTFAFKRITSQTYLVVTELQARILEEFSQPKSVPEVLENCIRARMCTALRDYYDLILKAHRVGVLRSEELFREGPPRSKHPPIGWVLSLPPWLVLPAALLAGLAFIAALVLRAPVLPTQDLDFLMGWLATCVAWSVGHILAASIINHGGGDVHWARLRWLTLTPHFSVDLREACMLAKSSRAAVYASLLLPLALTAATSLWLQLTWSMLPLAFLLLACRPLGNSAMANLLLAWRRRPLVDTDSTPLFDAPVNLGVQWRAAWKRLDLWTTALQLVVGAGWSFAIGHVVYQLLHLDFLAVLRDWTLWEKSMLGVAFTLAALTCLWLAVEVQHHVVDSFVGALKRIGIGIRRWTCGVRPARNEMTVETLIRRNPLLRRLDPDAQLALVSHLRPMRLGVWRTVVRFDQPADFVALIFSGRASVYRRLKSGRKTRCLQVMEGDLFGAHHLLDPRYANVEVRTNTPVIALTLSTTDFKRLVIDKLGAPVVSRYVDKHLFLQRSSALCADWRPAAVARLAEIAESASHPAGGKIIQQGEEVGSLYVLCEGRARALKNRKPVGRLKPGDFFGEISLLQTSAATADVETNDDSRCLTVNRVEFIRFMSRNHHVALQMEQLCSKRLGRPIFPFDGNPFDGR